jgi:translation initiation factor 2 beta subunit (eIF-2beta)/eIF-5
MSDSNILNVQPDASYWIYTMSKKLWDEYTRSTDSSDDDSLFISSYDKSSIKKGDIIFYYVKDFNNSGFMGLGRVSGSHRKNVKHIKVFNDRNLNEHVVKLNYVTFFNSPIKIKDIFDSLRDDGVAGHKTVESFRSKYMNRKVYFEKLTIKGFELMKRLFEISDSNEQVDDSEITDETVKTDACNSSKNSYKEIGSDEPDKIDSVGNSDESPSSANSTSSSVFIKQKSKTETEKDINESDSGEAESGDPEGEIPILIVKCKLFKWPSTANECIDYFIDHYKTCKECEITDNNNIQISRIIDDANIEYYVCKKLKDAYFEIPLQYYHELLTHDPINRTTRPFIRITRIENGHEVYQGCILITWII